MATKKAAAKKSAAKQVKPAAKGAAKKSAAKTPPGNEEALGTTHAAPKKKAAPTHDEIAKLAHKYWEERGGRHGSHHDDWLRAVKELGA